MTVFDEAVAAADAACVDDLDAATLTTRAFKSAASPNALPAADADRPDFMLQGFIDRRPREFNIEGNVAAGRGRLGHAGADVVLTARRTEGWPWTPRQGDMIIEAAGVAWSIVSLDDDGSEWLAMTLARAGAA